MGPSTTSALRARASHAWLSPHAAIGQLFPISLALHQKIHRLVAAALEWTRTSEYPKEINESFTWL